MQVTETLNEGLKRELKITVGADELLSKQDARLIELKDTVRLNGFRAGKVPMPHLKKLYGQQAMAEVIEKTVGESTQKVLEDRNEKPAYQPDVKVVDEDKMPTVLAGNADLELNMVFEVIPEIADIDFSKIKLEKLVAEVTDAEVDEALEAIAAQNKDFVSKAADAALEIGDQATIDFVGKVDDEVFDGGSAEGVPLEIGSNQFIPGFEEQLIGAKAGEQKTINVTFPDDYPQAALAGKEAVFDVTVQGASAPGKSGINDELAQRLGMENLDALKEAVRDQAQGDFEKASGSRLKRAVLDELDTMTSFELPEKMVEQEFEGIWGQVMHDIEHHGKTFEDEGTTEEDARQEYRQISERRIRLGLLLGRVGEQAGVQIAEEEVQAALIERIRQFPGQEKEVYDFYRDQPEAMLELRGPIFEQKVVDHIVSKAEVTEKTVSREELFKDPDAEEAEEKPAPKKKAAAKKKPAAKKAPAKKAASTKKAAKKADD